MKYTVKEVSILTGLSIRTLRYYDEINLLSIERNDSNYRMYEPRDIMKLSMIISLKSLGIPLKKINQMISEIPDDFLHMLNIQKDIIDQKINEMEKQKTETEQMIQGLKQGCSIEEVLLQPQIDDKQVDIKHILTFHENNEINFEYYFQSIFDVRHDYEHSKILMKQFIIYLNDSYSNYFSKEKIKELINKYESESARQYFNKYSSDFNLFLAKLLKSILNEDNPSK